MKSHVLTIDQGTSSSRAIIFSANGNRRGKICASAQKSLKISYPNDGWVEQNPDDILSDTIEVMRRVLDEYGELSNDIAAIGITNQRETTIIWDKNSGRAIYNAIVWQDRRMAEYCAGLKGRGHEDIIRAKTGLLLDPYFSATKIKWILDNVDGARDRAQRGELLFGTVECYLLWHLTGGKSHISDASNASRTMLYDIVAGRWDDELFELFDIPLCMAPNVLDNISDFGVIASGFPGAGLHVRGMAGDQQAALIGQGCLRAGMVKSTYGTGCFALMNIGDEFMASKNRLLTTIAYSIGGKVIYALEGSIFNAGTAIQFLRDNLGLIDDAKESEELARSVEDNCGVYFVPAFTGLGAPYWNPKARGIICGLGRDSKKAHIVRAALEAQGYQTRDLMDAMQSDGGHEIEVIRADGGLVANEFMCEFLSDVLGVDVEIPKVIESTAWGVAILAAVGAGIFSSLEDAANHWQAERNYKPAQSRKKYDDLYCGWSRAIERVQ